MSTVYLLYFLEDQVGLQQEAALQALTMLLGVYALGTILSAAVAGWASDTCGQRMPFVVIGSFGMAVACGLLLFSDALPMALAASALLGMAYGVYIASHQALVLDNLPNPSNSARDLGLFNAANTCPMVIAPAMAWICVAHLGGYSSMFGLSGLMIAASLWPLRRFLDSSA